ncbi:MULTISPECIES: hypothetical protein [unclassified Streptomyces]|uniref:Uncharacterized protein n=1 Tax=Streptomyces celluloflavus TaxID=58344 RepID=A0ABW7RDL5_9ACTN|nr:MULTISPECIES: hypothetical protein [unclassified Streptomyces]MCX4395243.1 hypothetical protein [Streptomyces sp. NBC_01767]MCX4549370.1 hypothetical protein [Streptomyces sp. NBC_01500]
MGDLVRETIVPKSGSNRVKKRAREEHRRVGRSRRYPDVRSEIMSSGPVLSSTELVPVCGKQQGGYAIFGIEVAAYRCTRSTGHEVLDSMGDEPPGGTCLGGFADAVHIWHGEHMALIAHETRMNTNPADMAAWFDAQNPVAVEEQELLRSEFGGDEQFFVGMPV